MILRSVLVLVAAIVMYGCANTSTENSNEHEEIQTSENHNHDSDPLSLDNGEKWKVDHKMMTFLINMETDINSFGGDKLDDYSRLADSLQENVNLLTSNCTMTGMAHDQLHIWLVPYINNVNEFSHADSDEASQRIYTQLKESFITFNQYFE